MTRHASNIIVRKLQDSPAGYKFVYYLNWYCSVTLDGVQQNANIAQR